MTAENPPMDEVRLEDVPAGGGYDVFDVVTGNLVTSYDDRGILLKQLPDLLSSVMERRDEYIVAALDDEGEILHSWLATDLFVAS